MKPRTDSVLATGMTSGTGGFKTKQQKKVDEKRQESRESRQEKQAQIKPVYATVIKPIIDRHREAIKSVEELEGVQFQTDENFRAEMMARHKFLKFLKKFDAEVRKGLKDDKVVDGDSFDEA